ncbi:hypothetical protein [Acaryochloris sp. IP29b_bin.137]|uniref:hypothetical protein n=1 Tax=Acaryochloris sp. IP29b_bin.137 TaxID=2969217 RepID=UPI0026316E9C|nr:hypothetical protein [Acaryochloris sp. IP29b_bin.137]
MPEIQPADPASRRKLLVGLSLFLLVMLLGQSVVQWFTKWLTEDPERVREYFVYIVGAIAVIFSPLLALGYYSWQIGGAVIRAKRFPPPGMKVIKDTVVVKGRKAIVRGRALQVCGAVMGGTAIAFPMAFWQILGHLLSETR